MSEGRQFLLYKSPDGAVKVEVIFQNETVWLTQKAIAELFGVKRPAVTRHLKNIFESGELDENSVCSKMEHTADDGKTYSTQFYNLDTTVSILEMVQAKAEYEIFRIRQDKEYISDFDRETKRLHGKPKKENGGNDE